MTRIETFTDAAFAFAVTLLVISTKDVPSTFPELLQALTGVPAFVLSFGYLMVFWYGHWKWSRRFGLEDGPAIVLSAALVLVVLIYIYPLKYLYSLATYYFSGGRISTGATIEPRELNQLFAVYGAGFVALNAVLAALNGYAYRIRERLELDQVETYLTRVELKAWCLVGGIGVTSVAVALLSKPTELAVPGWIYALLPIVMPVYGIRSKRVAHRLRRQLQQSAAASDASFPNP